jgi:hypothetical protein
MAGMREEEMGGPENQTTDFMNEINRIQEEFLQTGDEAMYYEEMLGLMNNHPGVRAAREKSREYLPGADMNDAQVDQARAAERELDNMEEGVPSYQGRQYYGSLDEAHNEALKDVRYGAPKKYRGRPKN